jgi:mRNA-degrading endonuclease YafQ of YafQ-DinJ toxin-antitoxin module
MKIEFDNPKHESLVNNESALARKYNKKGVIVSDDILATINVLKAAPTLFDIPRSYRPHPLKGVYKGCFAVDVTNTHRVIFRPKSTDKLEFRIDNPKSISHISILEIYKDYHDK